MNSFDDLQERLHTSDHQLWLLIGLCVALLATIEAVGEAVEGAWPHQRRVTSMDIGEQRAHPVWALVALAVALVGQLVALRNTQQIFAVLQAEEAPLPREEQGPQPRQVLDACYSRVAPARVARPALVACAREVAALLDLDPDVCESPGFAEVFAGNCLLEGMDPHAMCYGGHQFGHWAGISG